ncbi:MAG TPA: adenylate/guanylate cyclase domain-containing protein [Elusimicrobiota bacterium]|nr:adenylate/guanylate cyclase domain-containing protein [Elusimicrobiota bacterium]
MIPAAKALLRERARFLVPSLLLLGAAWVKCVELRGGSGALLARSLELRLMDAFQRAAPRPYDPELPVRIIDVDDATLARVGQWPWPRDQVARLVRRLSDMGAASIAFDAVFAEPDRTSPAAWLRALPPSARSRALLDAARGLPDHDEELARAIRAAPVVLGFAMTDADNGASPPRKAGINVLGDDPASFLDDRYRGAVTNLPVLEAGAAGEGSFNFESEADQVIRCVPLLFRFRDRLVPSLAVEAVRVAQGAPSIAVKSTGSSGEGRAGGRSAVVAVRVGGCPACKAATDERGRVWVHFTRAADDPKRVIPAWQALDKGFDPERVRGKILFVGTSAAGLRDLRATPANPLAAGVELHAQVAEQLLSGGFLRRPDWAAGAELLYMLLVGALLIVFMPRLGAALCAGLAAAATAAVFVFSWEAFRRWDWMLDPLLPSLAVLLVYLSSSLINHLRVEEERRWIREQFVRYMSPELVEELARNPEKLRLGGELREMTLLFSDIRGFTGISELFNAQELTQFINRYLTPMTDILLRHGAFIDKYMGDAIMAFWNAPLDNPSHVPDALRAALEMVRTLGPLNEKWRREAESAKRPFRPIRAGIGINTGTCCVGNMGSDQRLEYSVLGDDVNLASRLEGQSKNYGVNIVIGQNTRKKVPRFAALELDLIKVKGKSVPVRIFAVLGDEELTRTEEFWSLAERNAEFLLKYRSREWDGAISLAKICRGLGKRFELDHLYDLYEARIEEWRLKAPPADWDGSFTATEK